MQNTIEDIMRLENEFRRCRKILTAIGDDTRQHLLCIMMLKDVANHDPAVRPQVIEL